MNSIHTNNGATLALSTLRSIDSNLSNVQNNVSSGMRITEASNNAAYWSIATTMRSDNRALAAAGDSLGLGAAAIGVAYSGMSAAIDVVAALPVPRPSRARTGC